MIERLVDGEAIGGRHDEQPPNEIFCAIGNGVESRIVERIIGAAHVAHRLVVVGAEEGR